MICWIKISEAISPDGLGLAAHRLYSGNSKRRAASPRKIIVLFCPSMKRREIRTLYHRYPDLLARALAIEETAMPNLISVKDWGETGHGGILSLRTKTNGDPRRVSDEDLPCACRLESEKPELP